MKILITGASGFIGKYVLAKLLQTECTIIVAGRTKPEGFEESERLHYQHLDLKEIDATINYFRHFHQPDVAIHLAWQGLPNYTQLFHFEDNLFKHYQFLKNLVVNGLRSLTVTGTCFEYGMQEGMLTEDMPSYPDNAYALAKYTLYKFLTELKKQTAYRLTWMRLFYMYGAGQNTNSLFSQLIAALKCGDVSLNMSGGEQIRDFLPVETVAEMIIAAAMQQNDTGIVNCCSGHPVKVKDWVRWFLETQHKHIDLNLGYYPYAAYEPMAFWGSTEKLKKVLK